MGKPQPLKKFPEKQPSFDVSTSNAIKIQRVPLFWVQQFIRKPPVFVPREICRIFFCVPQFIFLLHSILLACGFVYTYRQKRENFIFCFYIVAKIEKMRYNISHSNCRQIRILRFDRIKFEKNIFFVYGYP